MADYSTFQSKAYGKSPREFGWPYDIPLGFFDGTLNALADESSEPDAIETANRVKGAITRIVVGQTVSEVELEGLVGTTGSDIVRNMIVPHLNLWIKEDPSLTPQLPPPTEGPEA